MAETGRNRFSLSGPGLHFLGDAMHYYRLDNNGDASRCSINEWSIYCLSGMGQRQLANTVLDGNVVISTIFVGTGYAYETMVFGIDRLDGRQWRSDNKMAALYNHDLAIEEARRYGVAPPPIIPPKSPVHTQTQAPTYARRIIRVRRT